VSTTGAGDAAKTTLVASSLIEFYDDFGQGGLFNGWYVYYDTAATPVERRIKEFVPESGSLLVYNAFAAQTALGKTIELHPYPVADYHDVMNQALRDVYSGGYYHNPAYNETLWGQNAYGEPDNEFNKYTYSVPTSFEKFPTAIYTREAYIGQHDGGDDAAVLTDSSKNWITNELVGETLYKKTATAASASVTANTNDDVTADISATDTWDDGDEYIIAKPNSMPVRFTNYTRTGLGKGGAFQFWANIPEDRLIILEGEGPLTAFSAETTATELYESQARVVAQYAAYKFCEMMSARTGGDRSEWNQKASEWYQKFRNAVHGGLEKHSGAKRDLSWL
jgi:hypothetical protein